MGTLVRFPDRRPAPIHGQDPDVLLTLLRDALADAERARQQSDQLRATLHGAKDQIAALREEVDKLSAPPATYGIFRALNPDGTATIYSAGRKLKVNVHPALDAKGLQPGQELILNDALNVVEAEAFDVQGEVARLKDTLDPHRVLVTLRADEDRVAELAEPLRETPLQVGDPLLYDPRSGYVLERLPKADVEDLLLEEVPTSPTTTSGA